MKLLLVKHSKVNHNADQKPKDWELSDEGLARCDQLAKHLASYAPKQIFSSAMPKAQQTATHVVNALGDLPVVSNALLNEHSRESNAPYVSDADFRARVQTLFAQPKTAVYGDESAYTALKRFSEGIQFVVQNVDPNENVVVVAHGTVITLFVAQHNTIDAYDFWGKLSLPSIVALDMPDMTLDFVIEDAGVAPEK
ncbi:MAG: histidine phosphatase family protein [Chloroflexota bacterium]